MFTWLSELLQIFVDFIPRPVVVNRYERLVCFPMGKWTVNLPPFVYIQWPLIAGYNKVDMRYCSLEQDQEITSEDGKSIYINFFCKYRVKNAVRYATRVEDGEINDLISNDIKSWVFNFSSSYTFARFNSTTINKVLRKKARKKFLKQYGIKVLDVGVTHCTNSRMLVHRGINL